MPFKNPLPAIVLTFGANVRRERRALHMTQERLGELAGIDRSYLQRLEKGCSNPSLDVAVRLKKALGCSWERLMS